MQNHERSVADISSALIRDKKKAYRAISLLLPSPLQQALRREASSSPAHGGVLGQHAALA